MNSHQLRPNLDCACSAVLRRHQDGPCCNWKQVEINSRIKFMELHSAKVPIYSITGQRCFFLFSDMMRLQRMMPTS
ncbi:Glutaredoxin domain-containing protein [Psidium guajava]|nr:Glutaredoxin domain-containing protein [Psidium guajava]